ncbi:hypothetical protein WJX72_009232 [[Myrmecia] bisecta]|uniref:Uncharacterized protein n=1 Tax=[Myrmecia] bisecta TaxID=41462 RepID=A0AAW1PTD9_9CHLO
MGPFDPRPAQAEAGDISDDDSAPQPADGLPGSLKSYTTKALSVKERAALEESTYYVEALKERFPLSEQLHQQTSGDRLEAATSWQLQSAGEGLAVSYSACGDFVAVGCRDGQVRVFNTSTGACQYTLGRASAAHETQPACTAVQFRPEDASTETKNVLVVARGDAVLHYHATTGQLMNTSDEAGNEIYTLSVCADGQQLATAGSDHHVRVYDEQTRACTVDLAGGDDTGAAGHSNSVYSVKWHPDDPQVLLSGGWDRTVQVWDLRAGAPVRSAFGPYICGDALDVHGRTILTGSWRDETPLQLWDYGSGQLDTNLPFHEPKGACHLYAAKFVAGANGGLIACGGSGTQPCARLLTKDGKVKGTLRTSSPVHAVSSYAEEAGPQVLVCCAEAVQIICPGAA